MTPVGVELDRKGSPKEVSEAGGLWTRMREIAFHTGRVVKASKEKKSLLARDGKLLCS